MHSSISCHPRGQIEHEVSRQNRYMRRVQKRKRKEVGVVRIDYGRVGACRSFPYIHYYMGTKNPRQAWGFLNANYLSNYLVFLIKRPAPAAVTAVATIPAKAVPLTLVLAMV